MKKLISLLLILTLLCCVSLATAEEAKAGEELDAAFQAFLDRAAQDGCVTLLMTGNPTTGYDWQYAILDEEVVSLTSEYISESSDKEVVGAGGMYSFVLKGLKAGETVIAFEYGQSWDDTTTVVSLMYFVTVDENLKVTVSGGTVGV